MTPAPKIFDEDDFRAAYLGRTAALRPIRKAEAALTLVASAACVCFSNPGVAGLGVVFAWRAGDGEAGIDLERTAGSIRTTAPRAALAAALLAASAVDPAQKLIVETASRYVFDIAKRGAGVNANADLWDALAALDLARTSAGGAPIQWRLVAAGEPGAMRRANALALRAAEEANRRRLGHRRAARGER